MSQPHDYRLHRQKVIEGVFGDLGVNKPKPLTKQESLMAEVEALTVEILNQHIRPILQAGGGFDIQALSLIIVTLYMDKFATFSKDELIQILAMIYMKIMLDIIQASPTGKPKPDSLSGI
jgi:hypothetical protein